MKKFKFGTAESVSNTITDEEKTWLCSYEPEIKQQSTICVFTDEPNYTKVVRSESTYKRKMITYSFYILGHNASIPLKDKISFMLNGIEKFVYQKSPTKSEKKLSSLHRHRPHRM